MANNRLVFDGLEQLKADLRRLPEDLAGEASRIVEGTANGAAQTIRAVYGNHRVTGHLQNNVFVARREAGRLGAIYEVKANSPHAWLFDNGSQARHWMGGKSTGRMWGKTPPTHVFARTMISARRQMYATLRGVLERAGMRVAGDA